MDNNSFNKKIIETKENNSLIITEDTKPNIDKYTKPNIEINKKKTLFSAVRYDNKDDWDKNIPKKEDMDKNIPKKEDMDKNIPKKDKDKTMPKTNKYIQVFVIKTQSVIKKMVIGK